MMPFYNLLTKIHSMHDLQVQSLLRLPDLQLVKLVTDTPFSYTCLHPAFFVLHYKSPGSQWLHGDLSAYIDSGHGYFSLIYDSDN